MYGLLIYVDGYFPHFFLVQECSCGLRQEHLEDRELARCGREIEGCQVNNWCLCVFVASSPAARSRPTIPERLTCETFARALVIVKL